MRRYINDVDVSQRKVDETQLLTELTMLKSKLGHLAPDLKKIMLGFDDGTGFGSKQDIRGACASLGLVLTEKEFVGLSAGLSTDAQGRLHMNEFCDALCS
jgi:hypothetical protein